MATKELTKIRQARNKETSVPLRVSEASRLLSLSRPTLMQWIRDGPAPDGARAAECSS